MTERDARTLYQELIVDHGRAPRNEGPLDEATHEATTTNPLCGDRVTLRLRVEGSVVTRARFEARGCMIARASASLLTETITGIGLSEAVGLARALEALVRGDAPPVDLGKLGKLEALRGVREFPARRSCALLAWQALESAAGSDMPASRA